MYCEGQLHEKEIVDILFISNCMTPNKNMYVCMYLHERYLRQAKSTEGRWRGFHLPAAFTLIRVGTWCKHHIVV